MVVVQTQVEVFQTHDTGLLEVKARFQRGRFEW